MATNADTRADVAASFGYTLAFFDSDPDLKNLLSRAMSTSPPMSPARFIAELRNTNWYRAHSESYRKYLVTKSMDPAELTQVRGQESARVKATLDGMGALVTPKQLAKLTEFSLMFGYTDAQLRAYALSYVHTDSHGLYEGDAGRASAQFQKIADDYGVAMATNTLGNFVKGSLMGNINEGYVSQWAAAQAASRYPALAAQLKAGQTLRQLADPYVQSYAKVLEMNPEAIKLTDPLLQQALTSKDAKGAPAVKTVWQFEQDLRNDPRWLKTQNAQDQSSSVAHSLLQSFGVTT